jgi:hypothetical protein
MNNVFDSRRLLLVLNKDIQENWKRYVLQFVTMFGVIAVVITFLADNKYSHNSMASDRHAIYEWLNKDLLMAACWLFAIFGIVIASTLMDPMNNKTKRISYLAVPASNVEKVFSRWLLVTVGYVIAFFVALWLADAIRVAICSFNYPNMEVGFMDLGKIAQTGKSNFAQGYMLPSFAIFYLFLSMYFFLQSIFILGATFWEKASYVKTFSAAIVLVILFVLVCRWAILFSYDDFGQFENVLRSFTLLDSYTTDAKMGLLTLFFSFIALFNWTLAFLRFKESEVIKRF